MYFFDLQQNLVIYTIYIWVSLLGIKIIIIYLFTIIILNVWTTAIISLTLPTIKNRTLNPMVENIEVNVL